MSDQIEPNRSQLKSYIVRYDKKRVGLTRIFVLDAATPELLVETLLKMFPGRGSFTFDEVER